MLVVEVDALIADLDGRTRDDKLAISHADPHRLGIDFKLCLRFTPEWKRDTRPTVQIRPRDRGRPQGVSSMQVYIMPILCDDARTAFGVSKKMRTRSVSLLRSTTVRPRRQKRRPRHLRGHCSLAWDSAQALERPAPPTSPTGRRQNRTRPPICSCGRLVPSARMGCTASGRLSRIPTTCTPSSIMPLPATVSASYPRTPVDPPPGPSFPCIESEGLSLRSRTHGGMTWKLWRSPA